MNDNHDETSAENPSLKHEGVASTDDGIEKGPETGSGHLPEPAGAAVVCPAAEAVAEGGATDGGREPLSSKAAYSKAAYFGATCWVWWLVPILALALWVRWPGLERSYWEDEVSSFLECRIGFGYSAADLERLVIVTAPTGFWSSHQVFKLCDDLVATGSAAMTRLPIVLLGLAGIVLAWRLGQMRRNWALGYTLALLLALWPFKANWDTQVRYYGVEIFLMLALILACEGFRRRPESAWRFPLAAVTGLLAALSFTVAAVLLALPWTYLAWSVPQRVAARLRRREWAWRRWGELAASVALQTLLLAVVTLVAAQFNRGGDWLVDLTAGLRTPPPEVKLDTRGKIAVTEEPRANGVQQVLPTTAIATQWVAKGWREAFTPRHWSPAPLLGMQYNAARFADLVRGGGDQAPPLAPASGRWLLIGVLAGSLAMLFISPPLLVSLWVSALATGLLLDLNKGNHFVASRYYAVPGMTGVILLAAGVSGVAVMVRWRLRCLGGHRRWVAWVEPVGMAAAGVALALAAVAPGRGAAAFATQNWKGLVQDVASFHPGGALYAGIGAKNVTLYQRLGGAAAARRPDGNYWTSARRDQSYDGFRMPWLHDLAMLDHFNACDTLVFFNYFYWPYEFTPFGTHAWALPPLGKTQYAGVKARVGDLGHRVFVTRGHAGMLLRPRLADEGAAPGEKGRRWTMNCAFEVPGEYDLEITPPAGLAVTALTINGAETPLAREEILVAPPAPELAVIADKSWMTVEKKDAPDAKKAEPAREALPYGLNEEWRGDPAERLPLPAGARWRYNARVRTSDVLTQTLTLTLTFDKAPTAKAAPALEWRLRESGWQAVTAHYEVGTARIWSDGAGFAAGVPVRVRLNDGMRPIARLQVVDVTTNQLLGGRDAPMDPRRGLEAGDIIWLGPYPISPARAAQWVGRPLALGILPLIQGMDPDSKPGRELFASERHRYVPQQLYCMSFVRFLNDGGQLRTQFAPPPQ